MKTPTVAAVLLLLPCCTAPSGSGGEDGGQADEQTPALESPAPATVNLRELWDFADPSASAERFRAAAAAATSPGDRAEAVTQEARALGLQGRFDEGHALLDALEDVRGRAHVRLLLERGRLLRSSGDASGSAPRFADALAAAETLGETALALDALHMLALVSTAEEADDLSARGVALAAASDDPAARTWLGPLHHNRGMQRLEAGAYPAARAEFAAGLAAREALGDVPGARIARWSVAHVLRLEGRVEEALAAQRALAAEIAADPEASPDGFVHEELGECLLALGRPGAARSEFARASALLSELAWLAESEPERLARLARLGAPEGTEGTNGSDETPRAPSQGDG